MTEIPKEWRAIGIHELSAQMPGFDDWVLCGGHSVARFVGTDSRSHGDIDVGVFRSQAETCLRAIGPGRVFLCRDGHHQAWDGFAIPEEVHDIWITDRRSEFWAFQVMIFEDDGDRVIFRRDQRITWPKSCHWVYAGGLRILNPFVTFLFKAHKHTLEDKEVHDLMNLIETGARPNAVSARQISGDLPQA